MKLIAIALFVFLQHSVRAGSLDGYYVKDGEEAVFKFNSVSEVSFLFFQIRTETTGDVIVVKGKKENEMIVKFEHTTYKNNFGATSRHITEPMEIPFIVSVDKDAEMDKVTFSPEENEFSIAQKAAFLTVFTFNRTRVTDTIKAVDEKMNSAVLTTPLGDDCAMQSSIKQSEDQIRYEENVGISDCANKTAAMEGFTISPESSYTQRYEFDTNPMRYRKGQSRVTFKIEIEHELNMEMMLNYKFAKFRPATTEIDASAASISYTLEALQEKLQETIKESLPARRRR